jgi:hypothetical protein
MGIARAVTFRTAGLELAILAVAMYGKLDSRLNVCCGGSVKGEFLNAPMSSGRAPCSRPHAVLSKASITEAEGASMLIPRTRRTSIRACRMCCFVSGDITIHLGSTTSSSASQSTAITALIASKGLFMVRRGAPKAQDDWLTAPAALSSYVP